MRLDLKSLKGRKNEGERTFSPEHRRKRTTQVVTFLFFVFLSAIFWFIQSLQMRFPYVLHIPITYDSIPPEVGLESHLPEFIEVSLEDEGNHILEYSIRGVNPITLHLKQHKGVNQGFSLTAAALTQEVRKRLSSSARITTISPSSIDVSAYHRARKIVPIVVGQLPLVTQGYSLGEVELTPSEVTIFASAKLLDSIRFIRTAPFEEQILETTTTTKVSLLLPEGVYASTNIVQAHLPVEQLTEQTITLPITVKDAPSGYELRPLPSSITLHLTLPRSRYGEVRADLFEVSVNYPREDTHSTDDGQRELPLQVTKKPSWVHLIRLNPDRVQYVIEERRPSKPWM